MEKMINNALLYLDKRFQAVLGAIKAIDIPDFSSSLTSLAKKIDEAKKDASEDSKLSRETNEVLTNKLYEGLSELYQCLETLPRETYTKELTDIYTCLEAIKVGLESEEMPEDKSEERHEKMCQEIQNVLKAIKDIKPTDLKGTEKALKEILGAVKGIKLEESEVDFSEVTEGLKSIEKKIPKVSFDTLEKLIKKGFESIKLEAVHTTLKEILEQLKKPVKIDEMQARAMSTVSIGGSGGPPQASRVAVTNVSLTLANTEYTHTFGAGTLGFQLRIRDTSTPVLVAYTTGKLPTSGDGLAYFTVPAYFIEKNSGLNWSNKVLYVQCESAGQTLEVLEYRG